MLTALIGLQSATRNSSNAQMGIMSNYNRIANMAFGSSKGNSNLKALAREELHLTLQNQQYQMQYAINEQLKKSYKQLLDKKIKESFSYFA